MPAKKNGPSNKNRNIILIIVLIIVGLLIIGWLIFANIILPKILSRVVDTALNASLTDLDFENAQSLAINQDLSNNKGMFLQMSINKGKIHLDANPQTEEDILVGETKYLGAKPLIDYQTDKDQAAQVTIKSTDQAGEDIMLHLSQKTNATVNISLGAGSVDIDLTSLNIPVINIVAGAGVLNIKFSKEFSSTANFAAGLSKLNISIPKGLEYRAKFTQGASNLSLGPDFIKNEDGFQTKGYDKATIRTDINMGQALGGFNIKIVE